MTSGTYISGILHGILILWALFGGFFLSARDPLPVQASNVSLISTEEFAALALPNEAPVIPFDTPQPLAPGEPEDAPTLVPTDETAPSISEADEVSPPVAEDRPVIPAAPVTTDTVVADQAPTAAEPPATDSSPDLVQPDDLPSPAPAPRVAPVAAPAPALDATIDDIATPEVVADDTADTIADETPATAPQEAAPEIVTEAEKPNFAPEESVRPSLRPVRPVQSASPSQPENDPIGDAVAEAAGSDTSEPAQPTGPPLTGSQIEGFRVAVGNCWNVDSGSAAARVTVTIGFSLDRGGKLVQGSLKFLDASAGEDAAKNAAFEAARRAIIRCGAEGYDLPLEKYARWKDIELTFNPEEMRIR